MYVIDVCFDLSNNFFEDTKNVEKAAGIVSSGSGAGFGKRDVTFSAASEKRAKQIKSQIEKNISLPGLEIEIKKIDD